MNELCLGSTVASTLFLYGFILLNFCNVQWLMYYIFSSLLRLLLHERYILKAWALLWNTSVLHYLNEFLVNSLCLLVIPLAMKRIAFGAWTLKKSRWKSIILQSYSQSTLTWTSTFSLYWMKYLFLLVEIPRADFKLLDEIAVTLCATASWPSPPHSYITSEQWA